MNVTRKVGEYMIIQKFGGIAMKNEQMRLRCIAHIKKGIQQYNKIVVIVSAIGRQGDPYATDSLLNITSSLQADKVSSDLVASCGELIAASVLSAELKHYGIQNTILYGHQAGIITDGDFGDAEIIDIDTAQILQNLEAFNCIIIPGFQGVNKNGEFMTLGRGGSDLTAVTLASALCASHAEFFKDVSGVMTADPSKTTHFLKLDELTFDEFLILLNNDRPIIQKRAALHAKKTATPLYIRGIASNEKGTWVGKHCEHERDSKQ